MRVKINLPSYIKAKGMDAQGYMDLQPNATLRDVYRTLGILPPLRVVYIAYVNSKSVKMNYRLSEGDVISFLNFIAGG